LPSLFNSETFVFSISSTSEISLTSLVIPSWLTSFSISSIIGISEVFTLSSATDISSFSVSGSNVSVSLSVGNSSVWFWEKSSILSSMDDVVSSGFWSTSTIIEADKS